MARRRMTTQAIADLLANSETDSSHDSDSDVSEEFSSDGDELRAEPSSSDTGWSFVTPETDRRSGVPIFNASPGPNPNLNLPEATLRPNRGAPAKLRNHPVPIKSHAFCRNNELMVVKMVDKKS